MKYLTLVYFPLLFSTWLVVSGLVGSGNAVAGQERLRVITDKNAKDWIQYDQNSVVPSGPMRFRVWVVGFDADHFPKRSLEEYDCANRIVRDVEVITERPNKPATHTFTPSEWRGIERESPPRGELYKILCR